MKDAASVQMMRRNGFETIDAGLHWTAENHDEIFPMQKLMTLLLCQTRWRGDRQ